MYIYIYVCVCVYIYNVYICVYVYIYNTSNGWNLSNVSNIFRICFNLGENH